MAKDLKTPSEAPTARTDSEHKPAGTTRATAKVVPITAAQSPRRSARRLLVRLASLLAAAIVVVCAVLAVLYRDTFSLDRARRWLSYLNVETSQGVAEQFSFESHKSNVYALAGDGLAIGSASGLTVFDVAGGTAAVVQQAVSHPQLVTGGERALLADLGGTLFCTAALNSGETQTVTLDETIYCGDMAASGGYCLVTDGDGCRAMVRVYDADGSEVFQWKSSENYLTMAALSDDGAVLAAVAANAAGTGWTSFVQLLRTTSTDLPLEVDLSGELALGLDWIGDALVVWGETQLTVLSREGQVLGQFSYQGRSLTAAAPGGAFAAAAFDQGVGGQQYLLTSVDSGGQLLGQVYLADQVRSLSASDHYIAALHGDTVTVYNRDLTVYAQLTGQGSVSRALQRGDGTVLLVGSGQATLYIPD